MPPRAPKPAPPKLSDFSGQYVHIPSTTEGSSVKYLVFPPLTTLEEAVKTLGTRPPSLSQPQEDEKPDIKRASNSWILFKAAVSKMPLAKAIKNAGGPACTKLASDSWPLAKVTPAGISVQDAFANYFSLATTKDPLPRSIGAQWLDLAGQLDSEHKGKFPNYKYDPAAKAAQSQSSAVQTAMAGTKTARPRKNQSVRGVERSISSTPSMASTSRSSSTAPTLVPHASARSTPTAFSPSPTPPLPSTATSSPAPRSHPNARVGAGSISPFGLSVQAQGQAQRQPEAPSATAPVELEAGVSNVMPQPRISLPSLPPMPKPQMEPVTPSLFPTIGSDGLTYFLNYRERASGLDAAWIRWSHVHGWNWMLPLDIEDNGILWIGEEAMRHFAWLELKPLRGPDGLVIPPAQRRAYHWWDPEVAALQAQMGLPAGPSDLENKVRLAAFLTNGGLPPDEKTSFGGPAGESFFTRAPRPSSSTSPS